MTVAAHVDARNLPAFQQASSSTHLAQIVNDPYRMVERHSSIVNLILHVPRMKLYALQKLPANWDGAGSARPDPLAISNAFNWLARVYDHVVAAQFEWLAPSVSASEKGEIVFEWWRGDRKLTVYCGADNAEFIRVWGVHIQNEMADGQLEVAGIVNLWKWLTA